MEIPYSGSPAPKVSWNFDGRSLRDNRRIRVENGDDVSTLFINRAERSDAGVYNMKLDNEFGSSHLKVKVVVLGE